MDAESLPSFYIERQESLAYDKFSKNGNSVDLHLVAKNIAFVIHVTSSFDLNLYPPSAKLIYYGNEEKEVDAVKSTPIEIVSHVDDTGFKAAIEVKVGVLSSQHEGAYFQVKFSTRDPVTGLPILEYSQPIKVISKRNQVKKIMERKQQALNSAEAHSPKSPTSPTPSTKRPLATDSVTEHLLRLEQQQQAQFAILQQLLLERDVQPIKRPVSIPDPDDMDFEAAFNNFLNTFKKVPSEERATKIRRVMKTEVAHAALQDFIGVYAEATQSSVCIKQGTDLAESSF